MTKSILKILGITLCTATIINSNQILMADVLNSTDEKISIETNETLNMDYFFDNICEKSTDENGNTIYKYSIKQYEDYMNSISNSEELFNTLNLSSDSLIFNTWQSNYDCFGDSLKSFSKEIYDIYKDKLKNIDTKDFTAYFNDKTHTKSEATIIINNTLNVYSHDYTEKYWLFNNKICYVSVIENSDKKAIGFNFSVINKDGFDDLTEVSRNSKMLQQANKIINEMNNQSNVKTTADKAAFLNEWLAKNVTYTTTYGELTTASPTGALVDKKATCQGFSLAYSYLCRKAGIPCLFVAGEKKSVGPHSWNYVKIDNKWYFVDTSANSKYNYINKTCSYYYYYFLRSMPSTYSDKTTRDNYPLPYSVNDYYITYGDMNSDGKITEADAERLLEYVQNNESVDFTLTQLIAAEVNADGEINAADAAQIRVKSINPSYKFGIIKQIESLN